MRFRDKSNTLSDLCSLSCSHLDNLNMSSKNDKTIKIYNKELNSVLNNMLNNNLTVSHILIKVSFLTVLAFSQSKLIFI